jgi:hypothetical protein
MHMDTRENKRHSDPQQRQRPPVCGKPERDARGDRGDAARQERDTRARGVWPLSTIEMET